MSSHRSRLDEGWYLMSVQDLELELRRLRSADPNIPASNALALPRDEALAYRNRGNLPDALGRTLRLVLRVAAIEDVRALSVKRLAYEPDFHDAPSWRREGSAPVNVVPLRPEGNPGASTAPGAWWEDPAIAALEAEWQAGGRVAGMAVPAAVRGFVYKTVLALEAAGRPVTPETVASSVARWVPAPEAEAIRRALQDARG